MIIKTGIALGILLVVTILLTVSWGRKTERKWIKKTILALNLLFLLLVFFWGFNLLMPSLVHAQVEVTNDNGVGLGYLAAGLAVGLASIGAGIGVGIAGSAAIGSISEKPEILGRTLIFVGLAEGVAIYGLIISIMILGRI